MITENTRLFIELQFYHATLDHIFITQDIPVDLTYNDPCLYYDKWLAIEEMLNITHYTTPDSVLEYNLHAIDQLDCNKTCGDLTWQFTWGEVALSKGIEENVWIDDNSLVVSMKDDLYVQTVYGIYEAELSVAFTTCLLEDTRQFTLAIMCDPNSSVLDLTPPEMFVPTRRL